MNANDYRCHQRDAQARLCGLIGTAALHVVAMAMILTHGKAPVRPERRPAPPVLVALESPAPTDDGAARTPSAPPARPQAASPPPASRAVPTPPRPEARAAVPSPPDSARPGSTATRRVAARRPAPQPSGTPPPAAPTRSAPAETPRPPVAEVSPPTQASTTMPTPSAAGPQAPATAPQTSPTPTGGTVPSAAPTGQPATPSPAPAAAPPSPSRTGPRVGAGFSEEAIRKVYPRSAIRMGLEGLVVLDVQVGADGRAREVRVRRSSGYDVLDEAAALMVREASFTAATVDGAPVTDWLAGLRIRFALER